MKKALLILLMLSMCFNVSASQESKPKKPKSGYNYKAHGKKNAKFKRNNERGNYAKCKRKH